VRSNLDRTRTQSRSLSRTASSWYPSHHHRRCAGSRVSRLREARAVRYVCLHDCQRACSSTCGMSCRHTHTHTHTHTVSLRGAQVLPLLFGGFAVGCRICRLTCQAFIVDRSQPLVIQLSPSHRSPSFCFHQYVCPLVITSLSCYCCSVLGWLID
jgi:hypothetical protein